MKLFFGRSTLPRKWGANIDKIDFFRMWVIWPQKHEKRVLRKPGVRERTSFFCISPPPGHPCGPYFKFTARTNNGNPAVLFSQCCKPHLENWQKQKKMCLNSTFFRYSATRSPYLPTKPSRGWLRVVIRKPRLVFFSIIGRHETKLRRKQGPTGGGVPGPRATCMHVGVGERANTRIRESGRTKLYCQSTAGYPKPETDIQNRKWISKCRKRISKVMRHAPGGALPEIG